MNNDLISRDALKKHKVYSLERHEYVVPVYNIDNAPTVEITEEQAIEKLHETGWMPRHDKEMTERPQTEWVSCKERMPDQAGWYLVTEYDYVDNGLEVCLNEYKIYDDDTQFWSFDTDKFVVIAWQPLPNPYKDVI